MKKPRFLVSVSINKTRLQLAIAEWVLKKTFVKVKDEAEAEVVAEAILRCPRHVLYLMNVSKLLNFPSTEMCDLQMLMYTSGQRPYTRLAPRCSEAKVL